MVPGEGSIYDHTSPKTDCRANCGKTESLRNAYLGSLIDTTNDSGQPPERQRPDHGTINGAVREGITGRGWLGRLTIFRGHPGRIQVTSNAHERRLPYVGQGCVKPIKTGSTAEHLLRKPANKGEV